MGEVYKALQRKRREQQQEHAPAEPVTAAQEIVLPPAEQVKASDAQRAPGNGTSSPDATCEHHSPPPGRLPVADQGPTSVAEGPPAPARPSRSDQVKPVVPVVKTILPKAVAPGAKHRAGQGPGTPQKPARSSAPQPAVKHEPPAAAPPSVPPASPLAAGEICTPTPRTEPAHAASARSAKAVPPHVEPAVLAYAPQLVVYHESGGAMAEQYRRIRSGLLAAARARHAQVTAVTGATASPAQCTTTLNLGFVLSELKTKRTLLIEANGRQPMFCRLFGRSSGCGLWQLLDDPQQPIDEALGATDRENLKFIAAGDRKAVGDTGLLGRRAMTRLLSALRDRFDHILIDSPAVTDAATAAAIGAISDQAILTVRLSRSRRSAVDRAARLLDHARLPIAGVIMTRPPAGEPARAA